MSTLVDIRKWIDEVLSQKIPIINEEIIAANQATHVQTWLTDIVVISDALNHLQQQLVEEKGNKTDNKKVLKNVLRKWEQWSGLEADIPTYIGELTEEAFSTLSLKGKLFKDLGAADVWDHGEFTHRLQWYVILHKWSNGFTSKEITEEHSTPITPKQFLIKCNTLPAIPKKYWPPQTPENQNLKLWDALFDRIMGSDWLNIREAWTCPELTNAMLIQDLTSGIYPQNWEPEEKYIYTQFKSEIKQKGYTSNPVFGLYSRYAPLLSEILTERFKKRANWDNENDEGLSGAKAYIAKKIKKNDEAISEGSKPTYMIVESDGVIYRD